MNIIGDAEAIAETVAPQLRIARWAVYLIGMALAAALVGFLVWWVVIRPGQLRQQAAQAHVDVKMSDAGAAAATTALKETVIHDREVTTIHDITREGENAVRSAAGADVHSPDVAAAQRAALCGMRTYQPQPGCATVSADRGSIGIAGADAGSNGAGR